VLLSSGNNLPHLIQKRRSKLGFPNLFNYSRKLIIIVIVVYGALFLCVRVGKIIVRDVGCETRSRHSANSSPRSLCCCRTVVGKLEEIFECAVVWRQETRSSADLLSGLSVFCYRKT
jgi:hypothetical protein